MSHEQGLRTEQYVIRRLEYVDEWYDLKVGKKGVKVEVKSTHLSVRAGHERRNHAKPRRNVGFFQVADPFNHETLVKEDGWYAFVVCHREEMLLLGFLPARLLPEKKHVSIHDVIKRSLLDLNAFIEEVAK